jgi:hypothetical protein
MRSVAALGAVLIAAFLLGGCPAQDQQGWPALAPAAGGAAGAQGDGSGALAPPGLEDGPASEPEGADEAAGSDTSAGDTSADGATEDGVDEQPVPDAVQIPQGIYVGTVTIAEVAHCSGLYAAFAGAELHNETEWDDYGITIYDDGLPNLEDQTVDMGGSIIEYTSSEVQTTADRVIVSWAAQINFIDPATGVTLLSMPGTETNVYRLTETGSLEIDFLLQAHDADQFGAITYEARMTGELTMGGSHSAPLH